jgi:hypothetical protein
MACERCVTRADFAYVTPKRILIYADGLEFHSAIRRRIGTPGSPTNSRPRAGRCCGSCPQVYRDSRLRGGHPFSPERSEGCSSRQSCRWCADGRADKRFNSRPQQDEGVPVVPMFNERLELARLKEQEIGLPSAARRGARPRPSSSGRVIADAGPA